MSKEVKLNTYITMGIHGIIHDEKRCRRLITDMQKSEEQPLVRLGQGEFERKIYPEDVQ